MKKINWTYFIIFLISLLFSVASLYYLVVMQWNSTMYTLDHIVVKVILILHWAIINTCFVSGIRDFVFLFRYWFVLKNRNISLKDNSILNKPKVILLYTTCDDFDEYSLKESIKQDYSNFKTYILDDSKKDEYKKKIDNFAKQYRNVKVIRRDNNKGFKAGNINNFLQNYDIKYDYFVLLDSDEIIPKNFISQSLKYFQENVGIVQANHCAKRSENYFEYFGAMGIESAWTTYITVKNDCGAVTLNGHGAIISKKCYDDVGGGSLK